MTTEKTNIPNQPSTVVRRTARVIMQTKLYTLIMSENCYANAAVQMAEQEVLHPNYHVLFNHVAVQNDTYITAVIMTQISLKASLKKWGKKGKVVFR